MNCSNTTIYNEMFRKVHLKQALADRDKIKEERVILLRGIVSVNFALVNPRVTIDKTPAQNELQRAIRLVQELDKEYEEVLLEIEKLWYKKEIASAASCFYLTNQN